METNPVQHAFSDKDLQKLSRRILVVDDEPAILFAYQKLLQSEGFMVDACEGLEKALCLIRTISYIAVITDIRLSGTESNEGIQLARMVCTQKPDTKVIVITGFGNSADKTTLKEIGVSHYFEKPAKPAAILELLKSI